MRELLPNLRAWRDEGIEPIGRAVVIRTFHSSPRPAGATLLVGSDGRVAGSVSGGCVEGAARDEVIRAHRDGRSRVIRYGISDEVAWDVGLACGGVVDVLVEPHLRPEVVEAATAVDGGGASRGLRIPLPADAPGPELGPHLPGKGEAPGEATPVDDRGPSRTEANGGGWAFVEIFEAAPRMVVVGAVHAAVPLVHYARELGWRTVVIDRRTTFATRERVPEADELVTEWPDRAAETIGLGPDDAVAVLSHDPKLDEPAIVEALRRGCWYVGAIGSRKTQADRRGRLLAAGLTDTDLARLRGPIGLDLGGREPAEVALAIIAEIVADRYGASAEPMRTAATRAAT